MKKAAKKAVKKVSSTPAKIAVKKVNPAKKSEMGLFARFWRVLTPSFLTDLGTQKSQGKSWGFWFLSNLFLVLVPVIAFFAFSGSFFAEFPENLVDKIPSSEEIVLDNGETFNVKSLIRNFELTLDKNGKLSSKNIPDPLIIVGSEDNGAAYTSFKSVPDNFAEFAFVMDTKGTLYLENQDKNFASYFYFLQDKAIIHDGRKGETQEVIYKDLIKDMEISELPKTFNFESLKGSRKFMASFVAGIVVVLSFFLYLFLAIFRLVNALFWALVFWAIGAIAQVKNWDFEKSFMAMLHFSFISMIFVPLAFIFDIAVIWYAFIVFGILFGMNFWEMEKK